MGNIRRIGSPALVFAAAGLIITTCSLSTMRGIEGRGRNIENHNRLALSLSSKKLSPDCLFSERSVADALTPVIGQDAAGKVAEQAGVRVQKYLLETAGAVTEEHAERAAIKLGSGIYADLMVETINASGAAERADFTLTATTMIASTSTSVDGANGAVYGPTVERCIDALQQACGN